MAELDDGGVVMVADVDLTVSDVGSIAGSIEVDDGVGSDTAVDLGVVVVVSPDRFLGDGNGDDVVAGADVDFAASIDGSSVRSIWDDDGVAVDTDVDSVVSVDVTSVGFLWDGDCVATGADVDLAVLVEVESVRSIWDDDGVVAFNRRGFGSGSCCFA